MVIGYDEWVRRFDGDPDIIGRSLQLGAVTYEIVGVMPEGFAFPVNHTLLDPVALRSVAVSTAHRPAW